MFRVLGIYNFGLELKSLERRRLFTIEYILLSDTHMILYIGFLKWKHVEVLPDHRQKIASLCQNGGEKMEKLIQNILVP